MSNAIVKIHKELLGRGPTHARAEFAGPDALVCVLEGALLPAERALVEIGEHERVREIRTILQEGTRQRFVETVEGAHGARGAGLLEHDRPAGRDRLRGVRLPAARACG